MRQAGEHQNGLNQTGCGMRVGLRGLGRRFTFDRCHSHTDGCRLSAFRFPLLPLWTATHLAIVAMPTITPLGRSSGTAAWPFPG
jgi:hypothetical protein